MEQQKVLWVLLSVLAVLMVVIMAGVFVFYPGDEGTQMAAMGRGEKVSAPAQKSDRPGEKSFDPIEYIKKGEETPGIEPYAPRATEDAFVVTVVEDSGSGEGSGMAPEPVKVTPPAAEQTPVAAPVRRKSEPKPTAVTQTAPAKPRTETEKVISYWIQVGSYGSRISAQSVKDRLKEKGVASIVSVLEKDDEIFYRVRIGAYPSKEEAEAFCGEIKSLQGFQGSYVSAVWGTRQVAVD